MSDNPWWIWYWAYLDWVTNKATLLTAPKQWSSVPSHKPLLASPPSQRSHKTSQIEFKAANFDWPEEKEFGSGRVGEFWVTLYELVFSKDIQRLIWCSKQGVWNVKYFKSMSSLALVSAADYAISCTTFWSPWNVSKKKPEIKALLLGLLRF